MRFIALLFMTGLLMTSCSSDDEMDDPINTMGTLTVVKDGQTTAITDFNNTLVSAEDFGRIGTRLDIRFNVDGGLMSMAVSNWDFQNPPTDGVLVKTYDTGIADQSPNTICLEEQDVTYCDGALALYLVGGTTSYLTEDDMDGKIVITANDPINKTVSGNFEFTTTLFGLDPDAESFDFSGTFTNLEYTAL